MCELQLLRNAKYELKKGGQCMAKSHKAAEGIMCKLILEVRSVDLQRDVNR